MGYHVTYEMSHDKTSHVNTVNEFKQNENWCLSQNTDNNGLFQTYFRREILRVGSTALELRTLPLIFRREKFETNQLEYSYTGRDQFLLKWLRVMNVPSLKGVKIGYKWG